MKSALITGATGFLGSHCAKFFSEIGWHIDGIDPVAKRITAPIRLLINDDLNLDLLKKIGKKYDLIVHCAGSGSVAYSKIFPYDDFYTNVAPLLSVLEYMRLYNTEATLIFPSSAAVYGSKEDRPLKETEELEPISPYGFHKKIAEELCQSYFVNFNLRIGIIRFFSLYGIGLEKQLLWDTCTKMSSTKGDLVFSGTGEETRDWIHINDAVFLIFAFYMKCGNFEIINGGSGIKTSVKNVITTIAEEMSINRPILFNGTTREGDPRHYQADISKASVLNWSIRQDLNQGIREYVQWFRGYIRDSKKD
jgi:UDP-glucose 4-epimerase